MPVSAMRSPISACSSGVTITWRWTQRRRFFVTAPHAPGSCACWGTPSLCPAPFLGTGAAESGRCSKAHIVSMYQFRNSLFGTISHLAARFLSRIGNFFAFNCDTLRWARSWCAALQAAFRFLGLHLFYQHKTCWTPPPNLNSLYETDGLGGVVLWLKTLTQQGFQPFSYLQ